MTSIILVRINCPDASVAEVIAEDVVASGLAACANVSGPIRSVYLWQGAVERAEEHVVLVKTDAARRVALVARVRTLHPHEVPAILSLTVGAETDFADWVAASAP